MSYNMKFALSILSVILGIFIGLYVGVWVLFIGGIIQIIQNATPTVHTLGIALGILRILCASPIGYIIVSIGGAIATAILT